MTNDATPQTAALAAIDQRSIVDAVGDKVRAMVEANELHLPPNYSAANACKSAWLLLHETENKDKKKVVVDGQLTPVVTPPSVARALMAMVTQGLDPGKTQCYFIVYGNALVCQRSTFGTQALYRRLYGQKSEVWSEVVYEGDEFKYSIERGRKTVISHIQSLENVGKPIIAAYATAEPEGREPHTEIMSRDQIQKAWEMGQTKGTSKAHKGFPEEMARKTTIGRVLKRLINSCDDSHLALAAREQDTILAAAEVEAEMAENANAQPLSLSEHPEPVVEVAAESEANDAQETSAASDSPKERFDAMVSEAELDLTLARRLVAERAGLDDVRQITFAHLGAAADEASEFVAEYMRRHPKQTTAPNADNPPVDSQQKLGGPNW